MNVEYNPFGDEDKNLVITKTKAIIMMIVVISMLPCQFIILQSPYHL